MSVFSQLGMYWRLATGIRGFLKEPITLEQARAIIRRRLVERENNLLTIVRRAIYGNKHSPYLKLLRLAGCEYCDFERMVKLYGMEPALIKLHNEGVYLTLEEFKGIKEVRRGRKVFNFKESDFDNPFLLRHLEFTTSSRSSIGTRTYFDLDYLASNFAVYLICLLDAYNALSTPIVVWRSVMPGTGPQQLLVYAKVGKTLAKWFSPVRHKDFRPSLKHRIWTNYIVYMGRLWGAKFPAPEYVPICEAWRVAQWIERAINRWGGCYVHTDPSNAVRICQAASEKDLDIAGTKFSLSGEPVTEMKRREIEAVGASVCSRYVITEGGYVGLGCFHPTAPDDVHFLKDSLALVQRRRAAPHAGVSANAFLFSSLSLSAPKVLLNVEIGDYGIVEHRSCGCYFDELGFSDHVYNIRSFDKLTSQGMTFFGTDLIRILEEVLPARFGGSSIDYQIVEQEDKDGSTYLSVLVSPEVGIVDEDELIKTVLVELGKGKDYLRVMTEVWSQAGTLRVKRMRPFTTVHGKLLPLHIQRDR